MRKKLYIALLIAMLLLTGSALADGSFSCSVENGKATITGYPGTNTSITVPASANGYPIVAIAPYAFSANTVLHSITIEEGLESIGEGAFYNCYALTSVSIPDSVHTLGSDLFYGCRKELTVYCSSDSYAAFYIPKQGWNLTLSVIRSGFGSRTPSPWNGKNRNTPVPFRKDDDKRRIESENDPYEKDSNYNKGIKARKNGQKEEALGYFKASANKGYAMGQYEYANCMENGWGTEKDYSTAYRYYRKAALQGNSTAQAAVGRCYLWGRSVSKDYEEAVSWFELSAEQGDALGQLWLGYCYQYGNGVEKDLSAARYYYELSADQGNKNAEKRLKALD